MIANQMPPRMIVILYLRIFEKVKSNLSVKIQK